MAKYLDENGLLYFWQKIKSIFAKIEDVPTNTSDLVNDSDFPSDANYVHTDNNFTTSLKDKLEGVASGAEVNQNAFSNVKVASTIIGADAKTDTLEFIAGVGIMLTPDAVNDKVTITAKDMVGAGASTDGSTGLVPAPSSGDNEKFLRGDGSWQDVSIADEKVGVTLGTTTKAYLLGVTTTPTASQQDMKAIADTGVYLDTTAGKLSAGSFAGDGSALTSLNASNLGSGTVPIARIPDLSGTYALKTDITNMYKYKGSVSTSSELPSSGQEVGDVYNIESSSIYGGPGMNVAWNGTAWDPLGEIFAITDISNSDIDTIVAS